MQYVLCIGTYNATGCFTKKQWQYFMEWCKTECNKLIVFTPMSYYTICSKMAQGCYINALNRPDKLVDIYSYEINVTCNSFWQYINSFNYDINTKDNISHMYFFNNKRLVAVLEVGDYENYIQLEDGESLERLVLSRELSKDNVQLCLLHKSDIDSLLRGEIWKPLGK